MRLTQMALALGLCVVLAAPAAAQRRPPATGTVVPLLGQNKQLQEELKIGPDQAEKVADALKKIAEEHKDDLAKARDRSTPMQERNQINRRVNQARTKALEGILKPEQMERIKQIDMQRAGPGAFSRRDVQQKLNITDEQKEKIKTVTDALQKDVREANQGGANTPEAQKKVQELRKAAIENIHKVLTDEQKKTFKEMLGEPFELRAA